MTFSSPESGGPPYTHLFACISEEDDGYVVQVRLYNKVKPVHAAWGEEIADSFESASALIASLAAQHSIKTPNGPPLARTRMHARARNH